MSKLVRLCFSLEEPLAEQFADLVASSDYHNRSEYIRDMIRKQLVDREWGADAEVIGTITLVYNHHQPHLAEQLIEVQHEQQFNILVNTHVHLEQQRCVEMLLIRGQASEIRQLMLRLQQLKGVYDATLSLNTTGKNLS